MKYEIISKNIKKGYYFTSLYDFLKDVEEKYNNKNSWGKYAKLFSDNVLDGIEKMKHSDKKTIKRLKATVVKLINEEKFKYKIYPDITGYQPCIPNVVAGIPQNMYNMKNKTMANKALNLLFYYNIPLKYGEEELNGLVETLLKLIININEQGIKASISFLFTLEATDIVLVFPLIKGNKISYNSIAAILNPTILLRSLVFFWSNCLGIEVTKELGSPLHSNMICDGTFSDVYGNIIENDFMYGISELFKKSTIVDCSNIIESNKVGYDCCKLISAYLQIKVYNKIYNNCSLKKVR